MTAFNIGKWRLQILQDLLAFLSLQALVEDNETLVNHTVKRIEENQIPWPPAFIDEMKTHNPQEIAKANLVLSRQMIVLLVTYLEMIINDFFISLFSTHPERMYSYLTPKDADNSHKGKVDLKEILLASSKEEIIQSLVERAASNATQGKFNAIIKTIEREAKVTIEPATVSELISLVELRNCIVHEASVENVTVLQVKTSAELIKNYLDLLGNIAENNGIAVQNMFQKLDQITRDFRQK